MGASTHTLTLSLKGRGKPVVPPLRVGGHTLPMGASTHTQALSLKGRGEKTGSPGYARDDGGVNVVEPLLRLLFIQLVRVRGDSMWPALRHGQWVWVDRRVYRRAQPARGDIVRLKDPSRPDAWVVKRIVGLPGETVRLEGGRLSVNGIAFPVLEVMAPDGQAPHDWATGPDEYVVLGDNQAHSTDSRDYGPVRRQAILGKVLLGGRPGRTS